MIKNDKLYYTLNTTKKGTREYQIKLLRVKCKGKKAEKGTIRQHLSKPKMIHIDI